MKPERIEALLRTKPPDEPARHFRSVVDQPATGALGRGRVRPMTDAFGGIGWAAVLVVVIGVTIGSIVLRYGTAGPSPSPTSSGPQPSVALGVIPWIDATPAPTAQPDATPDAASLPGCTVQDLALVAGGWGGATGSMAGGATLINLSTNPCRIWNPLSAQLSDATGAVIARLNPAISSGGGSGARAIPTGGEVAGIVVWMNWCDAAPKLPLKMTIYVIDNPEKTVSIDTPSISADVRDREGEAGTPRCDAPGAGSSVGAVSFDPPEPSVGGYEPQPCDASGLAAFSGAWGAGLGSEYANLVIYNDSGVDCHIPTSPTVELRDAHGALLASAAPWPDSPPTLVLPAGWTAAARIQYADWCISPPALPLRIDLVVSPPSVLQVAHSDGDATAIPVPGCISAPATPSPAFNYDTPFAVPGASVAPAPDPVDSLPLIVALSTLPTTAPGTDLSYTVTLTNSSPFDKPLNLAFLCPTYIERLFLPDGRTSPDTERLLNCGPIGSLAGRASVTLEMRLAIPSDAPTGTAGIVWQLGQRGPAAKSQFQIEP